MALQRAKGSLFNSGENLVISTLGDLATLPDTAQEGCVVVLGHTTEGDGGGGNFVYDAAIARSTANDGTIIDHTGTGVGNGCWLRIYSLAEGSLAWFGSSDDDRTNLTEARGVEGLIVTIVDGVYSGRFQYQAGAGNDGVNKFNNWVRINDVNFTSDVNLHSNVITNSGDAVNPTDVPNLAQVEAVITNVTTAESYQIALISGQQTYTFPAEVDLDTGSVFINGVGVDRGRLKEGVDYTVVGQVMTLVESYPVGTLVTVNWYSGNTVPVAPGIITKLVTDATYTISNSDIDYTLKFSYDNAGAGCVITIPLTGVWPQFSCLIHNVGGTVSFNASNLPVEISGWTDIMTDGWAALLGDVAEGDFNLTGDTQP